MEFSIHSPPYRPHSNGKIEGFHRFLKTCISKHINYGLEWDELTPMATACYNFFPNCSVRESAFFVMFGRDPINKLNMLLHAATCSLINHCCFGTSTLSPWAEATFLHIYFFQYVMEDEHAKEPSHNNPEEAADYVKAVNLLLQSFVNDIRGFKHYKRQDAYKTFLHTYPSFSPN